MNASRTGAAVILWLCGGIAIADAVSEAQSSADSANGVTGSAGAIMNNLIDPLMTGAVMMSMNKSKSFSAQLGCRSNSSFLELFIQPGPTGDVQNVRFDVDTDVDGELDTTWTVPRAASGICGNGFISCDPGTWSHCQAFAWTTNAAHMLDARMVSMQELGGCYCVNNHCGAGLSIANMNTILTDMGGGAAAALARSNPAYVITDVTVAPPTVSFRGQHTQGCAAGTIGTTDYVANPSRLSADAFSSSTANSTYQLIANSSAAAQNGATANSCVMQRVVPLDEVNANSIVEFVAGSGGSASCGNGCIRLTLGTVGNDYWQGHCSYFQEHASFNVYRPDRIRSATLVRAKYDDWMQVTMNGVPIWNGPHGTWNSTGPVPGPCELDSSWDQYPNVNFTSLLTTPGIVDFGTRTEVSGNGEGFALVELQLDTECKVLPDQITDTCAALAADSTCDLEEEKVDGVTTFDNFAATGLVPIAQSRTLTGSTCSPVVVRPWFRKDRIYNCRSQTTYNFDDAMKRKAYVTANATASTYADQRKDYAAGNTVTTTGPMNTTAMSNLIAVNPCTHVCKTQISRPGNDAALNGVVQDSRVSTPTNSFAYHQCNANDECPLEAGESIVQGCSCINDWAEAASIMQIMRMAGSDVICSSGTPAPRR